MTAPAITASQLHIMRHAIGWDTMSVSLRRTVTLAGLWRNHFVAAPGHDDYWANLLALELHGLMARGGTLNDGRDHVFYVTVEGLHTVRSFLS